MSPEADTAELDRLIVRLERAADGLRSGEVSPEAAATLVEETAVVASEASAELERLARAGAADEPPDQGRLT